jgi:hypothetical protein
MTILVLEAKQNLESLLHKFAADKSVIIYLGNQDFELKI